MIIWLLLRTILVTKNQGQSPGHWALDMKVVSTRTARLPLLEDLLKREAAVGVASLFLLIGLSAWGLGSLICMAPLAVDVGSAMADPDRGQALHDRLANTIVPRFQTRLFPGSQIERAADACAPKYEIIIICV